MKCHVKIHWVNVSLDLIFPSSFLFLILMPSNLFLHCHLFSKLKRHDPPAWLIPPTLHCDGKQGTNEVSPSKWVSATSPVASVDGFSSVFTKGRWRSWEEMPTRLREQAKKELNKIQSCEYYVCCRCKSLPSYSVKEKKKGGGKKKCFSKINIACL